MTNRRRSQTPTKVKLLGFLLTALLAQAVLPAISAEAAKDSTNDTPSTTTLKGTVVELSVTLNNLRDARLSVGHVRKAAATLYDEVTRQQVSMSYNPNVIGTTVIMTPTASFSGAYLPPRRKWVDEAMSEMGPTIKLFKEDVDTAIESNRQTDVSDATHEALQPLRTDAFAAIKAAFDLYQELQKQTSGGSYDNAAIANDVKSLDKQMKQLDKSLKKGIALLQKEAKGSKKGKSKSAS